MPTTDAGTLDSGTPTADAGLYIVRDNFNAGTLSSAWTTDGGVAVHAFPFAADQSVELDQTSNLSATFAPHSGRIAIEASVLARDTAGFKAIPYVYDASGNAVASVSFQDGNIQTHVGATITTIQPFVANAWYRVRLVVDTNTGTFDLYIDGVRTERGAALRAAAASISTVRFYIDGPSPGALLVDNVEVYDEAVLIGAPPQPVFDPRAYGAVGDGGVNDTAAIQQAVDAAAGTGGSVVLSNGTFFSGTVTLKSNMTFFIAPSAILLGSANAADYPTQTPNTGNTQLGNCQRALLYAPNTTQLRITGGGSLDGQGDAFMGVEATRPLMIWSVQSTGLTVDHGYLKKGAVWSFVSMESDHVLIDHVNVQSDGITHDGIDIVDGSDVTVQNCAVTSGDDAMCPKSGVRRGIVGLTIKDSLFSASNGGSNGIKFGTATYGTFHDITVQDVVVKNVQYAAMAVESRQGSDVDGIAFQRVQFTNVGSAFFVYLAEQTTTAPVGDVPKLGSMNDVSFTDVIGSTASWPASPHQGALITGHLFDGGTYPITNLSFTNVDVTFSGGSTSTPASPPEAMPNQYPEANMFGDLPAWGYYLRHVQGVTFSNCTSSAAQADVRQKLVTDDVGGVVGTP